MKRKVKLDGIYIPNVKQSARRANFFRHLANVFDRIRFKLDSKI